MHRRLSLEAITGLLDQHRQRASYGAVSALLGVPPRWVMKGLPRAPRYSWIVNAQSGRPSGYGEPEIHPELESNPRIIHSLNELRDWLETAQGS